MLAAEGKNNGRCRITHIDLCARNLVTMFSPTTNLFSIDMSTWNNAFCHRFLNANARDCIQSMRCIHESNKEACFISSSDPWFVTKGF